MEEAKKEIKNVVKTIRLTEKQNKVAMNFCNKNNITFNELVFMGLKEVINKK